MTVWTSHVLSAKTLHHQSKLPKVKNFGEPSKKKHFPHARSVPCKPVKHGPAAGKARRDFDADLPGQI